MLFKLANGIGCPEWAPKGSRYWWQFVNELWLKGEFYDHIGYSFAEETDPLSRSYLKLYEKRPSVRLNIPIMASNMVSRKLFAGKRAPRVVHKNEELIKSIKWMAHKSQLDRKILDAAYWAQGGSAGITLKIVNDVPCINVWPSRLCWPTFNDAEELETLMLAYCVDGQHWLDLGIKLDVEGREVKPGADYWYVRQFTGTHIITSKPIDYSLWNPVSGDPSMLRVLQDPEFTKEHKLGLVPAVWIRNLPGGTDMDGASLFANSLSDCIHLDYTMSQVGRGGNYASAPQLMVKGRILNYEKQHGGVHVMGPSQMLQLPADRKDGETSVGGADAKIIEMRADGLNVVMEQFVMHLKRWTQEAMSTSRKDPDTITGTISGKAMELMDEDVVDLVQVERTTLGEYGQLEITKKLALMCKRTEHDKFKKFSEDEIDELENEWPNLYAASPQEQNMIVSTINDAIDGGLMDEKEGRTKLEKEIDMRSHPVDGESNYKPTLKRRTDANYEPDKAPAAKPKRAKK